MKVSTLVPGEMLFLSNGVRIALIDAEGEDAVLGIEAPFDWRIITGPRNPHDAHGADPAE